MECIAIPWIEPPSAFCALANDSHVTFFDSAAPGDVRSIVSYICTAPISCLRLENDAADPFRELARWRAANRAETFLPPAEWPFPFAGGAAGWIGYDLGRQAAGVKSRLAPIDDLPGGWFGLYDRVIGFDHASKRSWILAPSKPECRALETRMSAAPLEVNALAGCPDWQAETSRASYDAGFARLREYIAAGDIYQANFTTRVMAPRQPSFSPASYYLALRQLSPAPFSNYIDCGDGVVIAGASPERFLRLRADGRVESRPIKGTAMRHKDPAADAAAARALRESPKERAENLMIVDLLRNDLAQVCEIGSIAVPELFAVESYAQAHHLVSAVTGRLRAGLGPEDLLAAAFPGGSITGAPKRRAMQIIDELEAGPRGAYCGMTGWIGFDGAMDSSVIIRSLVATRSRLYAQAGGGITWESAANAEYDEMLLKLSSLLAGRG